MRVWDQHSVMGDRQLKSLEDGVLSRNLGQNKMAFEGLSPF